jgi:serine/threonine-protein kinase
MKRSGPLFTLLAGLLLALFMLSLNATTGTRSTSVGSGTSPDAASPSPTAAPTATSTPGKPSPSPTPSPSKTTLPNGDYAGRTDDDSSAVAVTLRDGKAVAYFCDGRDQESWLKGDVEDDGTMRLTSQTGAVLTGELTGKRIRGTVDMGQREYGFTADKALKPSGLYRATATVRGATVDGGWIVLPDGRQVGILNRDGKPAAAPRIDPETGAVTVDGQQLTARPVTP